MIAARERKAARQAEKERAEAERMAERKAEVEKRLEWQLADAVQEYGISMYGTGSGDDSWPPFALCRVCFD